jgi:hypothetical protein
MKQTVTPQKAQDIFSNAQAISVYAELIDIEYNKNLVDYKFNDPALNNHKRRLKEATEAYQKYAGQFIQSKDVEYFKYEHCTALSEIIQYFLFMPIEGINEALERINELKASVSDGAV